MSALAATLTLAMCAAFVTIWLAFRRRRLVMYLDGIEMFSLSVQPGFFTFTFWAIVQPTASLSVAGAEPEIVQNAGEWKQYIVHADVPMLGPINVR